MKTAICSALAGVAMLALGGHASAGQPVQLSDAQMDGVTASGAAIAATAAGALGNLLSETVAASATTVVGSQFAAGAAASAALAASVFVPAQAASISAAAATLP